VDLAGMKICAVTAVFDFCGDDRIYRNYYRFRNALTVPLTTVELNHHRIADANHVSGKSVLWLKENLLDIGWRGLPKDYDAIGLFDGDIEFMDHEWSPKALAMLETHDLIQPWSTVDHEGSDGSVVKTEPCYLANDNGRHGHAWICRRDWLKEWGCSIAR
jgi:hypothetical protein